MDDAIQSENASHSFFYLGLIISDAHSWAGFSACITHNIKVDETIKNTTAVDDIIHRAFQKVISSINISYSDWCWEDDINFFLRIMKIQLSKQDSPVPVTVLQWQRLQGHSILWGKFGTDQIEKIDWDRLNE